jgi:hypothetical protein
MKGCENLEMREFGNSAIWEWNTDETELTNETDLMKGCENLGMWGWDVDA